MARDETYGDYSPSDVLGFWFPDTGHQNSPEAHTAFWTERMHGGMDAAIISGFAELTCPFRGHPPGDSDLIRPPIPI